MWQETHASTLNAPDSITQVNNDSMQKKQSVSQIDKRSSNNAPPRCPTCGKMHRAPCCKAEKPAGSCSNCRKNKKPEHVINNHPDSECWDLDPSKMHQAVIEKREATKKAREEGQHEVEAVILDYPMKEGQEELIQRAIGVINPLGGGQLIAQIDVRPEREEIMQQIFTHIEKKRTK